MNIDYEEIGNQIYNAIGTDIAIVDRYGFILFSTIKEYQVNTVLSATVLEFINSRSKMAEELGSKEMNSIVLSISDFRFVFAFSKNLILMIKIPPDKNLDKLLPSINKMLDMMNLVDSQEDQVMDCIELDLSAEVNNIEERLENLKQSRANKFEIMSHIIRQMTELQ